MKAHPPTQEGAGRATATSAGRRSVAVAAAVALAAIAALLCGAWLLSRAAFEIDVRTRPWRTHGGRLTEASRTGQAFRCEADGLRRIDVALVRLEPGDEELELVLLELPARTELRRARASVRDLAPQGDFVSFAFAPVAGSRGRSYAFELVPVGRATSGLSAWVRYRGQVGEDGVWGDRWLAGPVLERGWLSPHPSLVGLAFGFESVSAEAAVVLELLAADGTPLRRIPWRGPATELGFGFFAFAPLESRWTSFRYRLHLPEGVRVVGGDAGPTLKSLHGTHADGGALLGMTAAGTVFPERDLIVRIQAAPSLARSLARLFERGSLPLVLASVCWIAFVVLAAVRAVPPSGGTWRAALASLLGIAALHAAAYQLGLPAWMGWDEPWQVEYARYAGDGYATGTGPEVTRDALAEREYSHLQVRRRFPTVPFEHVDRTQRAILASVREHDFARRVDWAEPWIEHTSFDTLAEGMTAVNHPPLHAWLGGSLLRVARPGSAEADLRVLRLLSLLLGLAIVAATYGLARASFADARTAYVAAWLVACWPAQARLAAVVGNDVLAAAFVAVCLMLAARWARGRNRRWEPALLLGLALLGLAAKTTAVTGLVAAFGALVLRAGRGAFVRRVLPALVGLAIVLGVAAWIWTAQHNTAIPLELRDVGRRLGRTLRWDTLSELVRTSAGAFNWSSRALPAVLQGSFALAALAMLPPLVRGVLRRPRGPQRAGLLVCAAAASVQLALIALRGVAVFRYLQPAAPALAVLVLAALLEGRGRPELEGRGRPELEGRERPERVRRVLALAVLVYGAVFWTAFVGHQYLFWGD